MKCNNRRSVWLCFRAASFFVISILFLVSSAHCQENATAVQNLSSSTFGSTISGMVNDHIRPGTAYDSLRKKFLNVQTVDGRVSEEFGNVEAQFETGIDLGFNEIVKMLNGSIDVDVNFSIVRASAGSNIAKETACGEYSQSFTLHGFVRPKKRVFVPNGENFTLSPVGNEIATNYQTELYELAGDEFVTAIEYGAEIFINMKIDYRNSHDKSNIGGYLDVDFMGGVVTASGKLSYLDEETKKSIKINIKAFQKGGDPKNLLQIIPNNIATCTLSNPEPCFNLFAGAIQYARGDFQKQFSQLTDYNVIKYQTTRYDKSTLDLKRLVPEYQEITWATKMLMIELEEDYKTALVDEKRASDILTNYYSTLPDEQRLEVESIKTIAYDNAFIFATASKYCLDHPFGSYCQDYVENIDTVCRETGEGCIKTYDESHLEIPAEEISKWFKCENARQHAMNEGLVPKTVADGYLKMAWAPIFFVADVSSLGIAEWTYCVHALDTYGNYFDE